MPWLSTREGVFALGITVPVGKKLEIIPGHLIGDAAGGRSPTASLLTATAIYS